MTFFLYLGFKHRSMKSANLLVIALLYMPVIGYSQNATVHSPIISHYPSSGAYSYNFRDAFSIISNIGALSMLQSGNAGVYGERKFMLAETGMYTAIVTLPVSPGNFALQTDYFGYQSFQESQIGLAYGIPLNETTGISAKINYYTIRIPTYFHLSTVNFELGTVIQISDQLHTGISIYNPLNSSLGKNSGQRIASVYKTGLGYEVSPSFLTQLEVIKEKDKDVTIHGSLQYKPLPQIFARAGYLTDRSSGYFGVGYLYKGLRADFSFSFHQQLGLSPGLLLLYQFNQNAKK